MVKFVYYSLGILFGFKAKHIPNDIASQINDIVFFFYICCVYLLMDNFCSSLSKRNLL